MLEGLFPSSDESSDEDDAIHGYTVFANPRLGQETEEDMLSRRCKQLADAALRDRPTLPASWADLSISLVATESVLWIPTYICVFKACTFESDDRVVFLQHLGGASSPHRATIEGICQLASTPWMNRMDYVAGAVSHKERSQ